MDIHTHSATTAQVFMIVLGIANLLTHKLMDTDQLPPELDKDAPRRSMQRLVRLGESLGDLQPDLEFFDGIRWVKSGIITGTVSKNLIGKYRTTRQCN